MMTSDAAKAVAGCVAWANYVLHEKRKRVVVHGDPRLKYAMGRLLETLFDARYVLRQFGPTAIAKDAGEETDLIREVDALAEKIRARVVVVKKRIRTSGVPRYQAAHGITFTPDQFNVIDKASYTYWALVFDEGGTNALAGTEYYGIELNFGAIADMRFP